MSKSVKRCSRCILPKAAPNIIFDEKGVCNYCKTYKEFGYKGEDEFLRILNHHRNTRTKHECIVNISSGRDSAYALSKAKKDYMYIKILGMTEKDDFFAKMIREGLMTREEVLSRLERENEIPMDIINDILTKLGVSTRFISIEQSKINYHKLHRKHLKVIFCLFLLC